MSQRCSVTREGRRWGDAGQRYPGERGRLGPLTRGQLQASLDRFGLGRLMRAQAATDGLFGQNLFVTSHTGNWVLRGAPHFPWQFPTERFLARPLHERTPAPVPLPYEYDPDETIFGWPYVLMPRMPGDSVADHAWFATLTMEDRLAIAAAMGGVLADIHLLTWPEAGVYDADADQLVPFRQGDGARVVERIEELLAAVSAYPLHTTPGDVAWARGLVAGNRPALNVPFQPCAVMEDFQPGNVTIERADGRWRVSGVFDLLTFQFGDGERDLARLGRKYAYEDPRLAAAFMRAWRARQSPRRGFAARFSIYLLLDCLIIWHFCLRRDDIWWPGSYTLRAWVEVTLATLQGQGFLDD